MPSWIGRDGCFSPLLAACTPVRPDRQAKGPGSAPRRRPVPIRQTRCAQRCGTNCKFSPRSAARNSNRAIETRGRARNLNAHRTGKALGQFDLQRRRIAGLALEFFGGSGRRRLPPGRVLELHLRHDRAAEQQLGGQPSQREVFSRDAAEFAFGKHHASRLIEANNRRDKNPERRRRLLRRLTVTATRSEAASRPSRRPVPRRPCTANRGQ